MNRFRIATTAAVAFIMVVASAVGIADPLYPYAPRLSGPPPVGYWWCLVEFDIEEMRTSNSSSGPRGVQCRNGNPSSFASKTGYADGIELRTDGTGWDLEIDVEGVDTRIPEHAFRVADNGLLFSRDRELRWRWMEDGALHVQTQRNQYLSIEVVTPDVLRISTEKIDDPEVWREPDLMIRAGSPAAKRMQAFTACVKNNRRKPLFDVVDCGDPIAAQEAG